MSVLKAVFVTLIISAVVLSFMMNCVCDLREPFSHFATFVSPLAWLHNVENWEDFEKGFVKQKETSPLIPWLGATPQDIFVLNQQKANLVRFYLYTDPSTRFSPDEIRYDDYVSLASSKFDRRNPVKIFIHGFGHRSNCSFPQEIKDIYMAQGHRLNIIAVDWGALSMDASSKDPVHTLMNYEQAVNHVPIVGKRVGEFISFLYRNRVTYLSKVHIIGFSLGAHVAGTAGEHVYRAWLTRVSRITGLDPAGPLFLTGQVGRHLNENDADFVDFIHTDMGQCGTIKSEGHANFFMNNGFPPQPGCVQNILRSNFIAAIPLALSGSCSHNSAPLYYGQSIIMDEWDLSARNCFGYMSYRTGMCLFRSTATLGEKCDPGAFGKYYLDLTPMESSRIYQC